MGEHSRITNFGVTYMVTQVQRRPRREGVPARIDIADWKDPSTEIPTVFVVDPDPSTGQLVSNLVDGYRVKVQSHSSGRDFFAAYNRDMAGCIVMELRIFDTSGRQIQRKLTEQNLKLPVVFVTSGLDVATAVVLMREGAVHVIEKPLRYFDLLSAIEEALDIGLKQRRQAAADQKVRESICMLTCKERHFISLLAEVPSMKAIASRLAISPRAVEIRRRNVMNKLGFGSSMELLRFAVLARRSFKWLLNPLPVEAVDA